MPDATRSPSRIPAATGGVTYGLESEAWGEFDALVADLAAQAGPRVCDIGGGANPVLARDQVARLGLRYTVLDVSASQLAKTPPGYDTVQADIARPGLALGAEFDFAFSRMLAEHVADPVVFHRNVHRLLSPGGLALHFFPTLYSPPLVVNRLLPESVTGPLLRFVDPSRHPGGHHAKFAAYYRWCRGPGRRQAQRFGSVGFEVLAYRGFFGHGDYFKAGRFPRLAAADRWLAARLAAHPLPLLTSYAYVVLRKG